jgi:hypothetical protein
VHHRCIGHPQRCECPPATRIAGLQASGASANEGKEVAQKVKNPCKSDLQGFFVLAEWTGLYANTSKSMISLIFLQFTLQKICYHLCYHFGGITEANSKCKRS